MPAELPLVGICKNCKQADRGGVLNGRFLCHRCQSPSWTPPNTGYTLYFTTTSNSSSPSENGEKQ